MKRSIIPQTASDGQEVSVIYEITNNGSADVSSVSIKENASIAKDSASIGSIKAGDTAKHVFTVKMGKKDLTSSATVSFKAGGKSYTSKVENATIKYGKINLSATLSADKKGGAPGDPERGEGRRRHRYFCTREVSREGIRLFCAPRRRRTPGPRGRGQGKGSVSWLSI